MQSLAKPETLMLREAREAPGRVMQQLALNQTEIEKLTGDLRRSPPSVVMTCARGSSAHAATYAKYLIETRLGIPVLAYAPSVSSLYSAQQKMAGALFLAISQSGQSPDILMASRAAKDGGATIVALVNDTASPLAGLADTVIPLHAGAEKSVAATKTFICSLTALAQLIAIWEQNPALLEALKNLPRLLEAACFLDWSEGLAALKPAHNLFVVSRGPGLTAAHEAALKLKETCGLHAESFSAAEVKHGPMALVQKNFPVLMFSMQDQTQDSMDDVAGIFLKRSANILSAGHRYKNATNLDTLACAASELRPVLFIQSFYIFANALALARGFDPDHPSCLSKVTKTL